MYQNCPLHKLIVDHSSLTEVLRLHLLASGAKQTRGSCSENDDPGLHLRLEEPQIIKTLSSGSVFDLTITEKLKLLTCMINQIMSYSAVKDMMEESFEEFKQARNSYRHLQAAEKRAEAEDNLWKQKLRVDKQIPDMTALKVAAEETEDSPKNGKGVKSKTAPTAVSAPKSDKPPMTDEQIEAAIAKKDKDIARRKQDFLWKETELQDTINKHERKLGLHPFGRDRAFRRYWWFSTVPGLFVEHDDEYVGNCLPSATPYMPEVNLDDVNFVKANLDKV
jgi:bromodomain adjacent to zinc finger domain protein 1A